MKQLRDRLEQFPVDAIGDQLREAAEAYDGWEEDLESTLRPTLGADGIRKAPRLPGAD